jgi:hypothetical protein
MVDNNYIINVVLSKLDFAPLNIKIENLNNKIFIKCHNYYDNIFKDIDTTKINEYNQSKIFKKIINLDNSINISCMPPPQYYNEIINNIDAYYNSYKDERNSNLFICVNYADIIIDLDTKTYKIINIKFNIRKPTFDTSNLFRNLMTNINNPDYKFILHYDIDSFSKTYSDIKNNIYDLDKLKVIFTNNKEDIIIYPIYNHINGGTNIELNNDIDTKPTVSNQIKRTETTGIFI